MNIRYQRDLYRVQLCCDTQKEEKELGYPLQMCLRNPIRGLLPCHAQTVDGKLSVCWDVTSRHSVSQIVGEGTLSVSLLREILSALQEAMDSMAGYLVPCEYLVLDPACIYLTAEGEPACFLCDFENADSFRSSLLTLGEYVLEHMDHRDRQAMRLGYGLYRLAVEETFDRKGLTALLQEVGPETGETPRQDNREDLRQSLGYGSRPDESAAEEENFREQQEQEQKARQEALAAFFAEDEPQGPALLLPKRICVLGVAVILGILAMEGVVYFRNGRHISLGWIAIGGALLVLSCTVFAGMEAVLRWKQKRGQRGKHDRDKGKRQYEKKKHTPRWKNPLSEEEDYTDRWAKYPDEEKGYADSGRRRSPVEKEQTGGREGQTQSAGKGDVPGRAKTTEKSARDRRVTDRPWGDALPPGGAYAVKSPCNGYNDTPQETVVLSVRRAEDEETAWLHCEDGSSFPLKGNHWLIGKSGAGVDICLDDPAVSRLHARIYQKDGAYYIEDLNSRNGTWLGECMLESGQPEKLYDGAGITFADQRCTFAWQKVKREPGVLYQSTDKTKTGTRFAASEYR